MARRVLHGLSIVLVAVAGLCALTLVGVWLWFQSDAGQRAVLGRLQRELAPAGLEIEAGRLSGSLVSSLRLDDVTVRGCAQGLRVRVRRVTVRYPLTSVLRGRPRLDVVAEEPAVDDLPRGACARAHRGAKRLALRPVEVRRLQIERGVVALPGLPRCSVSGTVTPAAIGLTLAARAREAGPLGGPVRARLRLEGPPGSIRVSGEVRPGQGRVAISGRIDLRTRTASVDLAPSGLVVTPERGQARLVTSGRAHLALRRTASGRFTFTVRGGGEYQRRVIDPALHGAVTDGEVMDRFSETTQGAWTARIDGRTGPRGLYSRFAVELRDETRPAAVVKGTLAAPRGGRPRFHATIVSREGHRME